MGQLIGQHYEGDVRVSWRDDGDKIGIHYEQNIKPLLDRIAAENADGGVPIHDGLGALKYEFPISMIMEHATERGLSWEHIAYGPWDETSAEWKIMAAKWSKLTIEQRRKFL